MSDSIREIKELTAYLNKCRYDYYVLSRPTISDSEYDKLFDKLATLEKTVGFICDDSPTQNVGYSVKGSLPKVKHDYPLLSLAKTKDFGVAENYTKGREYLLMFKLDGLTVSLTYEGGELVEASTRGNGEEGSIITDNAKTFVNVPLKIPFTGKLKVIGEGLIRKDDFNEINSCLPDDEKYKTPRNLASGSIQQLDSKICAKRKVRFYAFNVLDNDEISQPPLLSDRLFHVRDLGFEICPFKVMQNSRDFDKNVQEMRERAESENIPIDGLVIMHNDIEYGKSLGRTEHHYKNGIALKFNEDEEETILRNIIWQVGRTGKITPVAEFDKVELGGTSVTCASLHNINIMYNLGVRKNATVAVVKKNEIIPQIVRSVGGTEEFEIPETCPVCGNRITTKNLNCTSVLWCDNPDCAAKNVKSLAYFVSKDCMNIDGLSEKSLEKLIQAGIVKNAYDLYNLEKSKGKIISLEGMGEKSYKSLLLAVEKSKKVKVANFIAALGIPKIALSKAKVISEYFKDDWNRFKTAVDEGFDFSALDGFGYELSKSIHTFFDEVFNKNPEYEKLVSVMEFEKTDKGGTKSTFKGVTFVITGSLNHFQNRKELQEVIENLGGYVASSVSKNTGYLINNDSESNSSKNRKAKSLNVKIITEEEFLSIVRSSDE